MTKLLELVNIARARSPYYKELYKDLSHHPNLNDIPIIDQESFWKANDSSKNTLLTAKQSDGIVFKSGGTTGNPKFSYFTREEWSQFTHAFGSGMDHAGFSKKNKVGNLFYAGELYASFIFIMKSMEAMKVPVIHYPLAGAAPFDQIVKSIQELGVNVLVGVPTTMMNFIAYLKENKIQLSLEKFFFGGEDMYDDQRKIVQNYFGDIYLSSIGYASVDGGHLGYVDRNCGPSEHFAFTDTSIMQIVDDDTGEEITELGKVGKLIYTNLIRRLMPIIRYPVGDRAMWVDKNKFKLMGRSEEGARVGPVTVNRDDVHEILEKSSLFQHVLGFQLVIDRELEKDRLTIVLGLDNSKAQSLSGADSLVSLFYKERPMYKELVEMQMIAPVQFKLGSFSELQKNPRTGKLKLVIDIRK